MIRFIDLTSQILVHEDEPHFAFYDTVTDEFKSFSGENSWHTKEEFIKDYKGNELDRYIGKIPDDFFERKSNIQFTLNYKSGKKFKLRGYQSPRGLRDGQFRAKSVTVEIKETEMNLEEFSKHIGYLITLLDSMEKLSPQEFDKRFGINPNLK